MLMQIPGNFEVAALLTTSPDEHKGLLNFIICGGGHTGIETAAEIYDLWQQDILTSCVYIYPVSRSLALMLAVPLSTQKSATTT